MRKTSLLRAARVVAVAVTALIILSCTGSITEKEMKDAKGVALSYCFYIMNEKDSSSIMNKDVSISYFIEFSTLSVYHFTAIRNFVEQNIGSFYGVPWQEGCNMITYTCWSLYESNELNLFLENVLKKDYESFRAEDTVRRVRERVVATVHSVIDSNMRNNNTIDSVYKERLREKKVLSENVIDFTIDNVDKVRVKLTIDMFGKVISAAVENSTMNDEAFENFLLNSIKTWDFGKIDTPGDTTELIYTFRFYQ